MNARFSLNTALLLAVADALIISAMLLLSVFVRPLLSLVLPVSFFAPRLADIPMALRVVFPLVWVALLALFSVYDGRKTLRVVDEFTRITFSSLLAFISLAGILYLGSREISRVLFVFFLVATYLALLVWRILFRLLYQHLNRQNQQIRRVLIIGAGPVGLQVQKRLRHNEALVFVGFLDDDPAKQSGDPQVLGGSAQTREIIQQRQVDDVVLALPMRAHARITEICASLQDLPLQIWIVPDYFQLSLHQAGLSDFAGLPMLDLRAPAIDEFQRVLKRLLDLTVILLILPPALALMALIALLIFIFDGRPILFIQKRAGENGRLFDFYKFRTMLRGADKMLSQVAKKDDTGRIIYKNQNDPRVTRLGRFLRRFSLDELPQLFNILKGDMSLVGPRPELPELVQKYQPWQRERFAVPQGLTGWWQIHGRSDKPMYLNTEEDLYYVKNYSFWLDIYILMKTFWVVIRGKGAY